MQAMPYENWQPSTTSVRFRAGKKRASNLIDAQYVHGAIHLVESMPLTKFNCIPTEYFGLRSYRKNIISCSGASVKYPVANISFNEVYLYHEFLDKNRIIYRLNNLAPLLSGELLPILVNSDGRKIVSDGNHRIAVLALLGFNEFEFRYRGK